MSADPVGYHEQDSSFISGRLGCPGIVDGI
jgi:hypothetical protein